MTEHRGTLSTQQQIHVTEMKNLFQSVLLIAALMSTTGAEEVIYAQVGETVTLKPPRSLNSQDYVYWLRDKQDGFQLAWRNSLGGKSISTDEPWANRLSLSDDSLIIKDIQQEHFGTFICTHSLRDPSFTSFKVLKLNVSVYPASPLLPGDQLSLSCKVETLQVHGTPGIRWLGSKGEPKGNQGSLNVKVTSQDNGQWTCVVTNNKKERMAKVPVTVLDLSPAPSQPRYTSKTTPLTVPCSFPQHTSWEQIKAKDIQEVLWHFVPKPGSSPQRIFSLSVEDPVTWTAHQDRGLRPAPEPKKGDLSLTKKRGRGEDRGDYVCALGFKNGVTLNRTVRVEVLEITSSPGTELISGQQLNLTCSLGHPLPSDLRLKWFPPIQSSLPPLTSDPHPAHLTIPEVGTGDGGKWRCELWQSNKRLTSAEITLKIEAKLNKWMLVVICSVTVIVILLLILVFILFRRRQQRMKHLRRRLCQCKSPKSKGFYRT